MKTWGFRLKMLFIFLYFFTLYMNTYRLFAKWGTNCSISASHGGGLNKTLQYGGKMNPTV